MVKYDGVAENVAAQHNKQRGDQVLRVSLEELVDRLHPGCEHGQHESGDHACHDKKGSQEYGGQAFCRSGHMSLGVRASARGVPSDRHRVRCASCDHGVRPAVGSRATPDADVTTPITFLHDERGQTEPKSTSPGD